MRILSTSAALAVFSAAMWFAWLGWDHEYYLVDGVAQGPYRTWQVVGCVAGILLATIVAWIAVRRTWAIFVLPAAAAFGFAVPWSIDAGGTDDTGLWVVGLFLITAGGSVALMTVTALASVV